MVLRPVTRGKANLDRLYYDMLCSNINDWIYSVDYISPSYWNLLWAANMNAAVSTAMLTYSRWYSASPYDILDDETVDTTKWTSSGTGPAATEADYYIQLYNNHETYGATTSRAVISTGSSTSFDLKTADNSTIVYVSMSVSGGNYAWGTTELQVSDGTHHVKLDGGTTVQFGTYTQAGYYEIVTDVSAKTVNVWRSGTRIQTNLDISSVTGNWYLRIYCSRTKGATDTGAGGASVIKMYVVGKMIGGGTGVDFIFNNDTNVIGNKFLEFSTWQIGTCSGIPYYSIDNAISWNGFTEYESTSTASYTQLQFGFVVSPPAVIDVTKENMAYSILTAYLYNLD